jgi:hypothetical protein
MRRRTISFAIAAVTRAIDAVSHDLPGRGRHRWHPLGEIPPSSSWTSENHLPATAETASPTGRRPATRPPRVYPVEPAEGWPHGAAPPPPQNSLRPGSTFYIVEFHPFGCMFDNECDVSEWRITEPYFHAEKPTRYMSNGSYADREAGVKLPEYEWSYPIGDVLNSLIQIGLQIEFMHEFPFTIYQEFPFLEKHVEWDWRLPAKLGQPLLLYSIRARKT